MTDDDQTLRGMRHYEDFDQPPSPPSTIGGGTDERLSDFDENPPSAPPSEFGGEPWMPQQQLPTGGGHHYEQFGDGQAAGRHYKQQHAWMNAGHYDDQHAWVDGTAAVPENLGQLSITESFAGERKVLSCID